MQMKSTHVWWLPHKTVRDKSLPLWCKTKEGNIRFEVCFGWSDRFGMENCINVYNFQLGWYLEAGIYNRQERQYYNIIEMWIISDAVSLKSVYLFYMEKIVLIVLPHWCIKLAQMISFWTPGIFVRNESVMRNLSCYKHILFILL